MNNSSRRKTQLLSSRTTTLNKVIFPALWLSLFGIGAIGVLIHSGQKDMPPALPIIFPSMWLMGLLICWLLCFPLKHVTLDSSTLRVRGLTKEIEIPLTDVVSVSGSFMQNPETITLRLRHSTNFGQKIKFMPEQRFFRLTTHPTIVLLREMIDLANKTANIVDPPSAFE
jgi:hypothetical protein